MQTLKQQYVYSTVPMCKMKPFAILFIYNMFSETKYICHVIMCWVVKFLDIWKITVSYILCCLH